MRTRAPAVHWTVRLGIVRSNDVVLIHAKAKELIDHLDGVLISESVEVVSGHMYVEVKPKGMLPSLSASLYRMCCKDIW